MTYEYKIGTSQAGLVTLASLGIPAPKHGYVPFSKYVILPDGSTQGNGWPEDEWTWGFITSAQRIALRTYIPSAGARIYIRDLMDDGTTWHDFRVQAEWPQHEDRQTLHFMNFTLKFRAMLQLADIP